MMCLRILVAATLAGSILAWRPSWLPLPGRSGFVLGTLGVLLLCGCGLVWDREAWRAALRRHRLLAGVAGLVVLSRLASAVPAEAPLLAVLQSLRVAVVLGFLLVTIVVTERDPGLRRVLAWTAAGLIALHGLLYLGGVLSPALGGRVFEGLLHQRAGGLPRFMGLVAGPGACGLLMICCAGLVRDLRHRRLRTLLTVGALLLAGSTFSLPGLAVGVALVWRLVEPRVPRRGLTVGAAAVCLLVLHVQPLQLEVAGRSVTLGKLPPGWATEGLGPAQMPVEEVRGCGIRLRYVRTAYHALAARSLECFAAHPVLGVGGRNPAVSCPVTTMNTVGEWSAGRLAHSEYTGLLAEHGLIGLVATLLLVLVLVGRYRPVDEDRWRTAALVAVLVSGFAGEVWYQFPVAALLGVSVVPDPGASLPTHGAPVGPLLGVHPPSTQPPFSTHGHVPGRALSV